MAKSKNITKTDDVAGDLLQILKDSYVVKNTPAHMLQPAMPGKRELDKDLLMQKLCSFVVRRDAKVFDHAFKLGKESNAKTQS
jgi:hypothetical protein